jgi:FdhD protein
VTTRNGLADLENECEKRTATTGCGQGTVFGDLMEDIDAVRLDDQVRFEEETLFGCSTRARARIDLQAGGRRARLRARPGRARSSPSSRTSGATTPSMRSPDGCGSRASTARQDLLHHGRLTSEMVIKAAQMGIPVLVSRSGLTKMGHEIAQKVGITMIGRAVNKHYLLFTGEHRW